MSSESAAYIGSYDAKCIRSIYIEFTKQCEITQVFINALRSSADRHLYVS